MPKIEGEAFLSLPFSLPFSFVLSLVSVIKLWHSAVILIPLVRNKQPTDL